MLGVALIVSSCTSLVHNPEKTTDQSSKQAPSNGTDILTFTLPNQASSVVDKVTHTVTVQMPLGTVLASLVPTITTSTGATINPLSGTSENFTNPKTYIVTAEDGTTTQAWVVTVHAVGQVATFTDGVTAFNMIYIPGGLTFPTAVDDSGTANVSIAYWIGET